MTGERQAPLQRLDFHLAQPSLDLAWQELLNWRQLARQAGLRSEVLGEVPPEWQAERGPEAELPLTADSLLVLFGLPDATLRRRLRCTRGQLVLVLDAAPELSTLRRWCREQPALAGIVVLRPELREWLFAADITLPIRYLPQLPPVPVPPDFDRPRPFTLLMHVQDAVHEEARQALQRLAAASTARPWRLCLYGDALPGASLDTATLGTEVSLLALAAADPLPVADLAFSLDPAPDPAWLLRLLALGIPLVAHPQSRAALEVLGDGYERLAGTAPVATADCLARLMDNPTLRTRLRQRTLAQARRRTLSGLHDWLQGLFAARGLSLPALTPPRVDIRLEGPFAGSYSLALVNRELAAALERSGARLGLRFTEGPGPIAVADDFLATHPDLGQALSRADEPAAAVLRLLYPPRVSDMEGQLNVLSCYGWEESLLPAEAVVGFNRQLDLITSMSAYVTRVLQDNGVDVPVVTVGLGVDHVLRTPVDAAALPIALPGSATTLKLLHLSSCFPRKGADVLLEAYAQAFSAADDVVLLLKTFPNPHHDIEQDLAAWRSRYPAAPAVELINQDVSEGAVRALYEWADVLVAPSRGEGFGLPLAEAMLHDCAVITTGHGGQRDFCTPDTSWLIDYRFVRARTHMQLSGSLWAEPDGEHLARLLRDFLQARREGAWEAFTHARRTRAARLIRAEYTWDAVAERTREALRRVAAGPALKPQPVVGTVTTWNSACGIAGYSQQLIAGPLAATLVFANRHVELINPDQTQVRRVWEQGGHDALAELLQAIERQRVDILLIQFNFGFFGLLPFARLLNEAHRRGIRTLVTFHSTADLDRPGDHRSLRQLRLALSECSRLLVHSSHDLNRLKAFGLADNLMLFPHGVMPPPKALALPAEAADLEGRRVVASYGFLLPPKGILQLIEAFAEVAALDDSLYLLLVNAQYPVPESAALAAECRQRIADLGLSERARLIDRFLDDRESLAWLSLAEVVVFPYQHTQESSSAAVRWGLLANKPVLCTPLDIFEDVDEAVYRLPGTDAQAIAAGLREQLLTPRPARQGAWLESHAWPAISSRVSGLFTALGYQDNP
ncbi:glycosyltransferase family 4 protein [Pseudomonas rhizoryzae]|uniref:glycosyltransferase family 4 protein n=1 Tax=Pseudomonas rhizoryzae TaxID=2571129 RepID=UPI000AF11EFC|nr:glycosyltransferase [Pseudomonas rhizoryzae]